KEDAKNNRRRQHRPWCRARAEATERQPTQEIHLYREVTSEALLVLLPVALLEHEVLLPNFMAAMALGLRRFFGGDPNHLELDLYSEPTLTEEGARRRYLVVYDTVPGGTGVLVELVQNSGAKLKQVFELARDALATCACQERDAR